jgi:hypothetical protein
VLRPFQRERLGHHVDASFAGAIHGGVGQTDESALRADIDDAAAAAGRRHRAGDRLAHEEYAAQVDRHHFVPVGLGDIEGGASESEAGVVDEHVDPTMRGDDGRYSLVDRGDVAYVPPLGVRGQAPRLGLGGQVGEIGVGACGRDDDRSGLGQQAGQFAPDSLRRAGDYDDAAAEIEAPSDGGGPWAAFGDRRDLVAVILHRTCPFMG